MHDSQNRTAQYIQPKLFVPRYRLEREQCDVPKLLDYRLSSLDMIVNPDLILLLHFH